MSIIVSYIEDETVHKLISFDIGLTENIRVQAVAFCHVFKNIS